MKNSDIVTIKKTIAKAKARVRKTGKAVVVAAQASTSPNMPVGLPAINYLKAANTSGATTISNVYKAMTTLCGQCGGWGCPVCSTTSTPLTKSQTNSGSLSATYSSYYNKIWAGYVNPISDPMSTMLVVSSDGMGRMLLEGPRVYRFKDGTILHVQDNGDFTINDKESKRIYAACRNKDFNPFLNASDLLGDFIQYLGSLGVKAKELSSIPVTLFINWLIIRTAEADNDPIPDGVEVVPKLLAPPKKHIVPNCIVCHRFIPKRFVAKGFNFCGPYHALQLAAAL